MKPAKTDKRMLKPIMIPIIGSVKTAIAGMPNGDTTALIIKQTIPVTTIPIIPLIVPVTRFSAINNRETSLFRPPRERITPISLTLSMTDMYVITAIMNDETTNDNEVKMTNAVVIMVIIVLMTLIIIEIVSV